MISDNNERATAFAESTINSLRFNLPGGPPAQVEICFARALNCIYGPVGKDLTDAQKEQVNAQLWKKQSDKPNISSIFANMRLGSNWNDASLPERYPNEFMRALTRHTLRYPDSDAVNACTDMIDHYPRAWEQAQDYMEDIRAKYGEYVI